MEQDFKKIIEEAWVNRELLKHKETEAAIRHVINDLDLGKLRVAEPNSTTETGWQVNEWVKKAVILYFPIQLMKTHEIGIFEYHDKMALKKGYQE